MASQINSGTENILKRWFPHTTVPFIASAPMYGSADAALACAVTKAGGYGFIPCGFFFNPPSTHLPSLTTQLTTARALLCLPPDPSPTHPLPLGVGFLTFSPSGFIENALPILLQHRVSGIWLAFPSTSEDHREIIAAIKAAREKENWDVKVFVQVGDVGSAREAVDHGADVIVVQGVDAGGHQWAQGAGVVALVPEVRDLVVEMGKGEEVAVVATGGMVDGRGVAAGLSLGADGVVMGTRFLCTSECPAPDFVKQSIISTADGARSTIKSSYHDTIQNYGIWPPTYDGRAIIGSAYRDHLAGVSDAENIARYKAIDEGDAEGRRIVYAGAGVGVIREIVSAKEVVVGTQREVKEIVGRLSGML